MGEKKEKLGFFDKLFGKKETNHPAPVKKMSGRAYTWPVPHVSRLEGNQMQPGQSIVVRGFITGDKRFDVNLATGPKLEGEVNKDDIALHVSCRLEEKKIILNSLKNNEWGKEERCKCPFKQAEEFDLRIRAHDDKFEVFCNHQEVALFDHRLPLNTISHIYVNGDVELFTCSWEGKYYSVPYEAGIPGNFHPGRKLYVSGEPEKAAKEFSICLHTGEDIAFRLNVRYGNKEVGRNSRRSGKWENEEKEGEFPFNKKNSFDLVIVCEDHMFKAFVDGDQLCTFAHRMNPQAIDKLSIDGDVELQGVHLK